MRSYSLCTKCSGFPQTSAPEWISGKTRKFCTPINIGKAVMFLSRAEAGDWTRKGKKSCGTWEIAWSSHSRSRRTIFQGLRGAAWAKFSLASCTIFKLYDTFRILMAIVTKVSYSHVFIHTGGAIRALQKWGRIGEQCRQEWWCESRFCTIIWLSVCAPTRVLLGPGGLWAHSKGPITAYLRKKNIFNHLSMVPSIYGVELMAKLYHD